MGGISMVGTSNVTNADNSDGFYVPDEAKRHERTFMQWPVNSPAYSDRHFLEMVRQSVAEIANAIVEFEPVVMLMATKFKASAQAILSHKIEIWDVATDDLWCRDSGPLFVRNDAGELAIRQLNFNGWGNKQAYSNDGRIAERVAEIMDLPLFDNGLVGEPGGVETNGYGTLIAHESSWINKNRNALSKDIVTQKLLEVYGADTMIWAPGVVGEDVTDYHIDALARFVGKNKVLIQVPDRIYADDPWSAAAFETRNIIENALNSEGSEMGLVTVPDPANTRVQSPDFVASYVNYYLCNGGVIAANFGDKEADVIAKEILRNLYPERDVITLNVDPIGEIGGGIHCATQQQPAV
ncbi:MAG: agmatine deiminase family protein [Rhizobiaceae bacterium]|nr:agmatine deiminase family protein [Rhizobiaceae bacterium]